MKAKKSTMDFGKPKEDLNLRRAITEMKQRTYDCRHCSANSRVQYHWVTFEKKQDGKVISKEKHVGMFCGKCRKFMRYRRKCSSVLSLMK